MTATPLLTQRGKRYELLSIMRSRLRRRHNILSHLQRRSHTNAALHANVAAALAYLAGIITGILFLVIEPYRRDRVIRLPLIGALAAKQAGL